LRTPGDNRAQGRWWTQLIFPVSGCGSNASVRVLPNPFPAFEVRPASDIARDKPPMLIAHLAFLLAAAFTGAAVYVAAVEQPARLTLDDRAALTQWKSSYARGKVMQAALAALGGALALWTRWDGGGPLWLAAGIVLLAPWPFTIFVIFRPTTFWRRRPPMSRLLRPAVC
jgi:hypothetical protein